MTEGKKDGWRKKGRLKDGWMDDGRKGGREERRGEGESEVS